MLFVVFVFVVAAAWWCGLLIGHGSAESQMRKGFVLADSAEAARADAVLVKEEWGRFFIHTTTKPLVEARVIDFDTSGKQWRFTARGHPLAQRLRFQLTVEGLFHTREDVLTGDAAFDDKVKVASTDHDGMRGVLAANEVRALVLELFRLSVSLIALMNDATLVVQWRDRTPTADDVRRRLLLTQQLAVALDRQFSAPSLPSPSTSVLVPTASGSPVGVRGL